MLVRDIMETRVVSIKKGTTYEEAAKILYAKDVSAAPVVDENDRLVGVISEKDLYRILFPFYKSYYQNPEMYTDLESRETKIDEVRNKKVEEFMSTDLATIAPDAPVMRAGGIMLARNVHFLPVVEHGKVVGIVSGRGIFKKIVQLHLVK